MSLSYVNIATKKGEGWLKLFIDDHCVALVDNIHIADKIRKQIPEKKKSEDLCECGEPKVFGFDFCQECCDKKI